MSKYTQTYVNNLKQLALDPKHFWVCFKKASKNGLVNVNPYISTSRFWLQVLLLLLQLFSKATRTTEGTGVKQPIGQSTRYPAASNTRTTIDTLIQKTPHNLGMDKHSTGS